MDFLYESGAKEVHMRSACPPIMYGCKYLNFSRSNSEMELIARRTVQNLEGDEGQKHLDEYADGTTQRGKCMLKAICEEMGFDSLATSLWTACWRPSGWIRTRSAPTAGTAKNNR